jgi:hypothetical protein
MAIVLVALKKNDVAEQHLLTSLSIAPGYILARAALLKLQRVDAHSPYPAFVTKRLPYVLGVIAALIVIVAGGFSIASRGSEWTTTTYGCFATSTSPPGGIASASEGGSCDDETSSTTTRVITKAPDEPRLPTMYLVVAGVVAAGAMILVLLPGLSKFSVGPGSVSFELASSTQPSGPTPIS